MATQVFTPLLKSSMCVCVCTCDCGLVLLECFAPYITTILILDSFLKFGLIESLCKCFLSYCLFSHVNRHIFVYPHTSVVKGRFGFCLI